MELEQRDKAISNFLIYNLVESLDRLRPNSVSFPVLSNSIDAICLEAPRLYSRKPIISLHRVEDKNCPGAEGHIKRMGQEFKVPAYLWTYEGKSLKRKVIYEGW